MTSYFLLCASFLSFYGFISTYTINYRRPCHNLSPECLTKTLQTALPFFANGAPELGLEPLDPCVVDHVNLTLSGLSIIFTKGTGMGLKTCHIDFARIIQDTAEMQSHCNVTIKGRYKSRGTFLMFPIDGDGISTIKCENLKIHSIHKLGTKIKNDQKYLEIKSSVIKHAYDGKVSYHMTNLFKNSPVISKAVLNFMNSNWRMVAEEFGGPLVDIGIKIFIKNIRQFLDVVPLNELERL